MFQEKKDCVYASIQRLEKYIKKGKERNQHLGNLPCKILMTILKKGKERLITATSNSNGNISTKKKNNNN